MQDDILERFRVVLSLRYLSVQLLLYRPVLADSLARGTNGEKQRSVSKVQANFNFMCVQVAEDIINIIHAVLTKPGLGRHLMGAWWFTLYYSKGSPPSSPSHTHLFGPAPLTLFCS